MRTRAVHLIAVLAVLSVAKATVCPPRHRISVEESTLKADAVFRGLAEVAYSTKSGVLNFQVLTTYKGNLKAYKQTYEAGYDYRQVNVLHPTSECQSTDFSVPDHVVFCALENNTVENRLVLRLITTVPWNELVENRVWLTLGWSSWSDWSSCSVSCGGGVQHRYRRCHLLSPVPSKCSGHSMEERRCNLFECEGTSNPLVLAERRARWSRVPGRAKARRLRPDTYVWLPASRHPFPDEFSLFVTLRAPRNGTQLGTIISVRSRRQHDAYLSLEVADGKLQLVHASSGGKTEVVIIPVELENGLWHQVALSVRARVSTVRSYVNCRWLRTDVLRQGAFQVPPDADLVIGYLFTGDLEQLTVASDPNVAHLQCSALVQTRKNDAEAPECESETDSLGTC